MQDSFCFAVYALALEDISNYCFHVFKSVGSADFLPAGWTDNVLAQI